MSKKVLLTGGAGLSRSQIAIVEGIEKITDQKITLYQENCNDEKILNSILEKENVDAVIHFAAYKSVSESVTDPLLYYHNNIGSIVALLKGMEKFKINRFIFSSSCTVYGQPDQIPVDETAPFKQAESPYGTTKQMCERILEDNVHANKNLHSISLRYFNPVGAHPSALIGELPIGAPSNLVPYVTQTAAGVREKLTVFGDDYNTADGSCVRDFIHVVDLAKAHVQAVKKIDSLSSRYEVFNLGTGKGETVLSLVNKFMAVSGVKLNYQIGPRRPGDIEKIYANPGKAEKVLGWKTQLSLEDSLRDAWNWEKKIRGLA
jgi:UDP-glucose 4-epimerase